MENPKVQKAFGLHVWPMIPTGELTGRPGAFLASTSSFEVKISGKGGHAAMPHLAHDPVAVAAKIITSAQTLISREQNPQEPGVVSVTSVNGGAAFNVIPSEVVLGGTIRSLSSANKDHLKNRLREIAEATAAADQCRAEFRTVGEDYPAMSNDPELWESFYGVAEGIVGDGKFPITEPMMGGEDFAYYGQHAPTCFIAVGCRNEAEGCTYGLHHPRFKADESAFHLGTALHLAFVDKYL